MKAADAQRMFEAAGGLAGLEELLGKPLKDFYHNCHAGSLQVLRTGIFGTPGPGLRVARGGCQGIRGQHSWIIIGGGPYDRDAVIADPTLWSYQDAEPCVHFAQNSMHTHIPHGAGDIWTLGSPPPDPQGEIVTLKGQDGLSPAAAAFLEVCGPLDMRGWMHLAHQSAEGWPSGEILQAMAASGMGTLIPIDILGMTTDLNPKGLYW